MKKNTFANITYEQTGLSSNLLYIRKTHLNSLKIKGNEYRDSELNFMFLEGLNPKNESSSKIELDEISVKNIKCNRSSQLFTTGNFFSELSIETSLRNSEFVNIQLLKLGKLFVISHQTKASFKMENI